MTPADGRPEHGVGPVAFVHPELTKRQVLAAAAFVALVAAMLFANTLGHDFTLDDETVIVQNTTIRSLANVPRMFTQHFLEGGPPTADPSLYRPLSTLSFALNFAIGGLEPRGYHLGNVVLHALASVLVFLLALRVLAWPTAVGAALVFAAHPIHSEAVANVTGRSEILASLGVLGALLAWCAARAAFERADRRGGVRASAVCVASFALGLFSKESGIVALALCAGIELVGSRPRWLLARARPAVILFALLLALTALWFGLRASATEPALAVIGLEHEPVLARYGIALRVLWQDLGLLVAPVTLSAIYTEREVGRAASPFEWVPLVAIALVVVALVVAWITRRTRPGLALGVLVFAVAFAPVSNLVLAIGVVKAERVLYAPSIGFVLVVAALLEIVGDRWRLRWLACSVLVLLASAYGARTVGRNRAWYDDETLGRATLRTAPLSPLPHGLLARSALREGDLDAAREHARANAELTVDASGWMFLAELERTAHHAEDEIEAWKRALEREPSNTAVLQNLSTALLGAQRAREALLPLERLCRLAPNSAVAHANRFAAYSALGDHERAAQLASEAARRFPEDATLQHLARDVLRAAGRSP